MSDDCDVNCGPTGGPYDVPGCGRSDEFNSYGIPDACDRGPLASEPGGPENYVRVGDADLRAV